MGYNYFSKCLKRKNKEFSDFNGINSGENHIWNLFGICIYCSLKKNKNDVQFLNGLVNFINVNHGRSQDFLGGTLRQFSKNFVKIANMHYFSTFFSKFNNPWLNFSRIWTKSTIINKF